MNRYEVNVRIEVDAEDILAAEDIVRDQLNHVDIRRKPIGRWFWDGTMVRIGTSPFVQGRLNQAPRLNQVQQAINSISPRGWTSTDTPLTPDQAFEAAVLPTPPGWMKIGYPFKEAHENYRHWIVQLGNVEGFRARLVRHKETGLTQFTWGCRTMENEAQAHAHWWPYGIDNRVRKSSDGGRLSYRADELIAYAAACSKALGWDWHAAARPATPPMPARPDWLQENYPRRHEHSDEISYQLGTLDGFEATVVYDREEGSVALFWGCRQIDSEAEARVHWVDTPNGVESTLSYEPRPHALLLIDYVVALCEAHGWDW